MKMTLNELAKQFGACGVPNPENDALILVSEFTGKDRAMLICSKDEEFETDGAFLEAIEKRKNRFPLQYILGTWEFMGLDFKVNEDVLIPRSDTEILCEFVIKNLPENGKLLDLCTGSGCIAVSVRKYRPDSEVYASDISEKALKNAEENADTILEDKNKITFFVSDATEKAPASLGKFDIICANPPYVTLDEMSGLEKELTFEPRNALTDGGDGLSIIKGIVRSYVPLLSENGIMVFEHGYAQGENVRKILLDAGLSAETIKDFSGNERVTFGRKI